MTATPSFFLRRPRTWLLAASACAALGTVALQPAFAQGAGSTDTNSTQTIKAAEIATTPLYEAVAGDRPTMTLVPSVEFPTAGAQFRGPESTSVNSHTVDYMYSPDEEYLSYYNHEMCYVYNKAGNYFEISRRANNRRCSGDKEFSGNFLNWATASSMDIMRLALTGGDRIVDTEGKTVLQRAYLPDGTADNSEGGPGCFFKNDGHFRTKMLRKADGGGNYAGAIPKDMIEALEAQGKTALFINNMANKIYFGVHAMGGIGQQCEYGPYNYMLGAGGRVNEFHSTRRNAFFGSVSKHDTCDFGDECEADDDGQRVWFGRNMDSNRWITGIVRGKFKCGGSGFLGANAHGDNNETATLFNNSSKCYLEDDDAILSGDDFFYARVKVCDAKDERDYTMCVEYPSGKKKPTGVIQKYADNLRLAVFGYVMEHTKSYNANFDGRFGGTLRAPMKYVGQNTYSHTGVKSETPNPRAEWDPQTGVFYDDPEGLYKSGANNTGIALPTNVDASAKISGVINYFNRFGRNPKQPGLYKGQDPVSELYYEALRYLQGLGPTPQAVERLNNYRMDGFPVYTSWDGRDPFGSNLGYSRESDYTCLNNSVLIIGDVNTHDVERDSACQSENPPAKCLRYTMKSGRGATDGWNAATNTPDARYWANVVRAHEKAVDVTFKDGAGTTRHTWNPEGANITGSEQGIYLWSVLPGLAYWAHTHDIRGTGWTGNEDKQRPGLRLTTYTVDVNESRYETRYTKRIGQKAYWWLNDKGEEKSSPAIIGNQYWLAAKYGGFRLQNGEDDPGPYNTHSPFYDDSPNGAGGESTAVWADWSKAQGDNEIVEKTKEDGTKVREARHPEPRTYYMPSSGRAILAAFDSIFGAQEPPKNRSIAGADSSGGIGSHSYQAEFDGRDWSGDVIAETVVVGDQAKRELRAGPKLEGKSATRKIIMGSHDDGTSGGTKGVTTAFEFKAGSVPTDVSDALDGTINNVNATAAERINWLRGDRSKEGNPLRKRATNRLLGDIINSGVKYVGAPAGSVNLGLGYDAFVDAQTTRRAAVYVGANDGMLHAFHAGGKVQKTNAAGQTYLEDAAPTLDELFAYIPSWMKGKLAALTDPNYITGNHQLYVDATPVIGDANLKPNCTVTDTTTGETDCEWRSVLVSGTGGGGKGVFALDVTNPEAFGTDKVLWEFTDTDDPDMGYVLGQVRIVKLYVGNVEDNSTTPPSTRKAYRWFAMVPAGVNNYAESTEVRTDGNGDANIFLLALDKPSDEGWGEANTGGYYWKLQLPRIEAIQTTHPTGILNLEAFTGLGGVTEYVYAGDLHGQLWGFAFKDTGSNLWNELALSNNYNDGTKIKPLYVAKNAAGEPQPITVAPTILEGAGNGVHFVSFGTGKYFEPTDANTTKIDSFYTVYSNFNHTTEQILSRTLGDAIIPGRSFLQKVEKYKTETDEDGTPVNYYQPTQAFFWGWRGSAPIPNDDTDNHVRSGWYLDFVNDSGNGVGERQIADASWVSLTSRLMFSTLTPSSATNTDVCGTSGGSGKLYTFDMVSGKGTGRPSAVGMLAQPLVFLDTANTRETQADSTGRRLRVSPVMSGQFGADGSAVSQVDTVIVPFGRLSWRRIDNFQQLRKDGQSGGTASGTDTGTDTGN